MQVGVKQLSKHQVELTFTSEGSKTKLEKEITEKENILGSEAPATKLVISIISAEKLFDKLGRIIAKDNW